MSEPLKEIWPSWRYGPKGEAQVFEDAASVPTGWKGHPSEHKGAKADDKPASESQGNKAPAAAAPAGGAGAPLVAPSTGDGGSVELDAHGHPWSADLHSATKNKTTQGLWRMKVGVSRPAPADGFPKLDL